MSLASQPSTATGRFCRGLQLGDSVRQVTGSLFELPPAAAEELLDVPEEERELMTIRHALTCKLRLGKRSEDVEVLRQRPNNPLYSVKTFEQLHLPDELLNGLYDLNFRAPSRIQETALPILLANP